MAKKHRNLIERIACEKNLRRAYLQTARGKRRTFGYLEFKEYAELNLALLGQEILNGSYLPGKPREFLIHEPKPRLISAIPFRDRVAQHALVNVIGPIFEATLLPRTYACRKDMGTHAAVISLQSEMRKMGTPLYALKTDFAKYFSSIDRGVLHRLIAKKISCAATLRLISSIVPPTGCGLPIGALTSQLFANVYGGQVDRLIHCGLGERHWYRYMDDIVVLGKDLDRLRSIKRELEELAYLELGLRLSRWSLFPVSRGVNFLGYRIWPTHKLLRKSSAIRARRRLRVLRAHDDAEALQAFSAAWSGHAQWADSHNLLRSLSLEEK